MLVESVEFAVQLLQKILKLIKGFKTGGFISYVMSATVATVGLVIPVAGSYPSLVVAAVGKDVQLVISGHAAPGALGNQRHY